jgi:trimeric autotransporter adhesin
MSTGVSDSNLGLLGGRQRPNATGDPNTSGSDNDRVASDDNPDALYFTSRAFANPGAGQYGNAPRTNGDARYQFRKNIDLVLTKDTTIARTHSGQIRFEILNLTNTAKFRGIDSNSIDSSAFGRITQQAGFMRIWQLSFRYRF